MRRRGERDRRGTELTCSSGTSHPPAVLHAGDRPWL
jgi:hypothetical protein